MPLGSGAVARLQSTPATSPGWLRPDRCGNPWAWNRSMSQPWILMCPPDHFGIEYEINPWMSRSLQADRLIAAQQWCDLKELLEEAGARISLMEAGGRSARPGLHGQRGHDPSAAGGAGPIPPPRTTRGRGLRRTLADGGRVRGVARAGRNLFRGSRRRPLLGRHAVCRLPHSQRRPRTPAGRRAGRLPGDSARTGRRPLLSPRHLLVSAGARAGDLLSRGIRQLWSAGAGGIDPRPDRRGTSPKPSVSPATRSSSAERSSPTPVRAGCTPSFGPGVSRRWKRRWTNSSKPAAAPNA